MPLLICGTTEVLFEVMRCFVLPLFVNGLDVSDNALSMVVRHGVKRVCKLD